MSVRNGIILALAIIVNVVTYLTLYTFHLYYFAPIILSILILIFLCKNNMLRLVIFLFSLPVIVLGLGVLFILFFLFLGALDSRKQTEELMSSVMVLCI
ncbi:hypothetical protein MM221_03290 [Salipaludibacillus sp. LMS25]|uniref:hypothetical protein n=1 Tax=Salipaludibacillus sp. LMS25 TaxID=2924031 RepID=UPI0020D0DF49|nr:hypothetical protein [Salipaludibacillus sp. LMS25]UTR15627.1 hypothetical protein MM221_03290 [Salipaludibacillus sp. LMS25]